MDGNIKETIQEVIKKQSIILGPDIAILKAKEVNGLVLDNTGKVISVSGDELNVLQNLIDQYVSLSGEIIRKAMEPLLQKHLDQITNMKNGNGSNPSVSSLIGDSL